MKRLQSNAGEIIAPLVGGWAVKETRVLGKYSGIAADILIGLGIGVGAKAVLDPPVGNRGGSGNGNGNTGAIKVISITGAERENQPALIPGTGTETGTNPYA
ncbi:hypothetical protein MNV_1540002 [Candidatus Methanoperedens nitroreducens]|uniref:Uncharacterized protein n=2 Tax=Candidatus Methanoperedens nitratireducens TaxID=1392998 RepID=A0A284VL88_9EURY|nr:hypothetical protein MNV_1540002 [Candidatus Methanoperedens nitroreducens]